MKSCGHVDHNNNCWECTAESLRSENAKLRNNLLFTTKLLVRIEQFCTWLCEDSSKYPGTDVGNGANSIRTDIRKALASVGMEK